VTTGGRDETSTFRHRVPGCLACGAPLARATTGRRRLFCGAACRQRAYRLRVKHRGRRDAALRADPADVRRLLAAMLRHAGGR
jgi:hypothetical protein